MYLYLLGLFLQLHLFLHDLKHLIYMQVLSLVPRQLPLPYFLYFLEFLQRRLHLSIDIGGLSLRVC